MSNKTRLKSPPLPKPRDLPYAERGAFTLTLGGASFEELSRRGGAFGFTRQEITEFLVRSLLDSKQKGPSLEIIITLGPHARTHLREMEKRQKGGTFGR